MVVLHFETPDGGDATPVQAAVVFGGRRVDGDAPLREALVRREDTTGDPP